MPTELYSNFGIYVFCFFAVVAILLLPLWIKVSRNRTTHEKERDRKIALKSLYETTMYVCRTIFLVTIVANVAILFGYGNIEFTFYRVISIPIILLVSSSIFIYCAYLHEKLTQGKS